LIDSEGYADCSIYPKEGNKILTPDVDEMILQTYIKPIENEIRLFVLSNAENMTAAAQNKILKTLEEPPKGVCILIGATGDYTLLPTVKSRVKRIDIPPFGDKILKNALIGEFSDIKRLDKAISLGGGKLSEIKHIYNDAETEKMAELCKNILKKMQTSKDVLAFSTKIDKDNVIPFIAEMKAEVMRVIKLKRSGLLVDAELNEFKIGALLAIEDLLSRKERALAFSANIVMTVDSILFGILEEKYRWQKL
jgi:DNA polymerase-3 subunit delta'